MALLTVIKTENHYHGEAPRLIVNAEKAKMSDNSIKVPALVDRSGFEIFKIILTQVLAFIGALGIIYITYVFGWNGKSLKPDCYLPSKEVVQINKIVPTPFKQNIVTEKKS